MAQQRLAMRGNTWTGVHRSNLDAPTSDNIARTFTPSKPMKMPGAENKDLLVSVDIPTKLKEALADGLQPIGLTCLRENAKLLLRLYESMCLEHVLTQQVETKAFAKLLVRDPAYKSGDQPAVAYDGWDLQKVAKSSFLGRDPWGDNALPEPAIAGIEANEEEGTEAVPAKYSKEQLLLMDIQDRMYAYLTTHLWRILDESINVDIRAQEILYDNDEGGIREQAARKRMPWKEYKRLVVELLPKTSGLYELGLLLTLHRKNGETPRKWAQRLALGKMAVEDKDVSMPDAIYVEILLKYMTLPELNSLAREEQLRKISSGGSGESLAARLRPATARLKLFDSKLAPLLLLVETTLKNDRSYRCYMHKHIDANRLFTAEQAREYAKHKGTPTGGQSRPKRGRDGQKMLKRGQECLKCKKAGLTGDQILHDTKKCDPRRRARNIRHLLEGKKPNSAKKKSFSDRQKRPQRKKFREQRANTWTSKGSSNECRLCKNAGRRFRHPFAQCKYRKGGAWYGLNPQQLAEAKKKYYEENQKRKGQKGRTFGTNQKHKRCRVVVSKSPEKIKLEIPYWQKEHTLWADEEQALEAKAAEEADENTGENSICSAEPGAGRFHESDTPGCPIVIGRRGNNPNSISNIIGGEGNKQNSEPHVIGETGNKQNSTANIIGETGNIQNSLNAKHPEGEAEADVSSGAEDTKTSSAPFDLTSLFTEEEDKMADSPSSTAVQPDPTTEMRVLDDFVARGVEEFRALQREQKLGSDSSSMESKQQSEFLAKRAEEEKEEYTHAAECAAILKFGEEDESYVPSVPLEIPEDLKGPEKTTLPDRYLDQLLDLYKEGSFLNPAKQQEADRLLDCWTSCNMMQQSMPEDEGEDSDESSDVYHLVLQVVPCACDGSPLATAARRIYYLRGDQRVFDLVAEMKEDYAMSVQVGYTLIAPNGQTMSHGQMLSHYELREDCVEDIRLVYEDVPSKSQVWKDGKPPSPSPSPEVSPRPSKRSAPKGSTTPPPKRRAPEEKSIRAQVVTI